MLIVVVVVAVIVGGSIYLVRAASGYYVFSPGNAPVVTNNPACKGTSQLRLSGGQPCARIDVPAHLAHAVDGSLLMVDVSVAQATPIQFVLGKLHLLNTFQNGAELIPAVQYTGGLPSSQVACQNVAQMTGSQLTAPVAALRHLGYHIDQVDRGASLAAIEPGSPAAAAGLACNETITALNGQPVTSSDALVRLLRDHRPGQTVALTVTGAPGQAGTRTVNATLGEFPASQAKVAQLPAGSVYLGISTSTNVTYHLPFDVTINSGNIGGPSAGLAFTLGIMDLLGGGQLTNGKKVAATGTIAANGDVGDVGGVAQKTVAVRNAGATVFFVPQGEYKSALSQAGSRLKVFPVTTLDQVLNDLRSLGGQVPPPGSGSSSPSTTAPPAG